MTQGSGPLSGVKVIELAGIGPSPYCCMLLADARVDYLDAIVDYNRAQFAIYVGLGQPPANSLAHPVPVEGVFPGAAAR